MMFQVLPLRIAGRKCASILVRTCHVSLEGSALLNHNFLTQNGDNDNHV